MLKVVLQPCNSAFELSCVSNRNTNKSILDNRKLKLSAELKQSKRGGWGENWGWDEHKRLIEMIVHM